MKKRMNIPTTRGSKRGPKTAPLLSDSPKKHRRDWVETHQLIEKAFFEYVSAHKQRPSYRELAELTGLDKGTIENHMKELSLPQLLEPFKVMSDKVMMGLVNGAIKGNPVNAKLYYELVHDWEEGTKVHVDQTVKQTMKIAGQEVEF